jgi:hypothetical protein
MDLTQQSLDLLRLLIDPKLFVEIKNQIIRVQWNSRWLSMTLLNPTETCNNNTTVVKTWESITSN